MPELLFELGTEELPAFAVHRTSTELGSKIASLLEATGVLAPGATPALLATPRRQIVSFSEVAARQEDSEAEQRGPGIKAAYDAEGKPTQALLGFCRGQGVDVGDVRQDGQYVWVTKKVQGQPTLDLLKEILPKAVRALTFDKTMRWGFGRMRFARPIRWLLASFGGELVPFEIEGVASGLRSFGHRLYAPGQFEAATLQELVSRLREKKVEPDSALRRTAIVEGAKSVAEGVPDLPEGLVEENVYLTEWPTAIQGTFLPDYLELPPPVLVTAMAKHERMFPVRDREGKLTNRFVFIRNSGEDDSVRGGCEWVLNARFNDARFFFEEDKRRTLDQFLESTQGILFQEKLGTVRQRAERLEKLARQIAVFTGAAVDDAGQRGQEEEFARLAGKYAKADLATGLVGELASLQGIIGGEYARREGLPDPVCWAIASQYDLSKNPRPDCPGARTAVRLVIADQLDKLAGYLGLGLEPSGSSDPFALRRAASLLIEAAWGWPTGMHPYENLLSEAFAQYRAQGVALDEEAALAAFRRLFASRYSTLMPGVRYDMLEAALRAEEGWPPTIPQSVRFRARILDDLAQDVQFVQTATRPLNIVAAARKKGIEYETSSPLHNLEHAALESAEGLELLEIASEQQDSLRVAAGTDRDEEVIRMLKRLEGPINAFFDSTMVMADQPEVRYARLTLMAAVAQQLLFAGDFSKLVIEG